MLIYKVMKLQQSKSQLFVNIPSALARAKQWKKGDDIDVRIDKQGNIVLVKKE